MLSFGISDAMILVRDVPCHAVLRSWFAVWFANFAVHSKLLCLLCVETLNVRKPNEPSS